MNREPDLTIVGIGASAGGLEALSAFFDSVPLDTAMVFVVVTHLHPEHESHMAELLQRHTQMPTMQVNEKVQAMDGQGGLLNVRQRLSLMGCQMKIDSSPGKGTRVIVDVPSQEVK